MMKKYTLEEGLEIMWTWTKKQSKRDMFQWNNFEIEKKICLFWKEK